MCEAALSFLGPLFTLSPLALTSPADGLRTSSLNCRHTSHANIRALPHAFHHPGLPQRRKGIKFANDNE